jgi:hypothetical protein
LILYEQGTVVPVLTNLSHCEVMSIKVSELVFNRSGVESNPSCIAQCKEITHARSNKICNVEGIHLGQLSDK